MVDLPMEPVDPRIAIFFFIFINDKMIEFQVNELLDVVKAKLICDVCKLI